MITVIVSFESRLLVLVFIYTNHIETKSTYEKTKLVNNNRNKPDV